MQKDFHASDEKIPAEKAKVPQTEKVNKESFIDFIRFAILAAVIVIPFRLFIAQPFIVSGSSMIPSYTAGNYLIIDELTYRWSDPKRGDVVVFRFPLEPSKFLIKRVVALPNETLEMQKDKVTIYNSEHPDGFEWQQGTINSKNGGDQKVTLKDDEYFVLGDNRDESADSRIWGPLKREFITGRPLIRLLPVTEIDVLPGKWDSEE